MIHRAGEQVFADSSHRTRDLGGALSTVQLTALITHSP